MNRLKSMFIYIFVFIPLFCMDAQSFIGRWTGEAVGVSGAFNIEFIDNTNMRIMNEACKYRITTVGEDTLINIKDSTTNISLKLVTNDNQLEFYIIEETQLYDMFMQGVGSNMGLSNNANSLTTAFTNACVAALCEVIPKLPYIIVRRSE